MGEGRCGASDDALWGGGAGRPPAAAPSEMHPNVHSHVVSFCWCARLSARGVATLAVERQQAQLLFLQQTPASGSERGLWGRRERD